MHILLQCSGMLPRYTIKQQTSKNLKGLKSYEVCSLAILVEHYKTIEKTGKFTNMCRLNNTLLNLQCAKEEIPREIAIFKNCAT